MSGEGNAVRRSVSFSFARIWEFGLQIQTEAGLKTIRWCAALAMMASMCLAQTQPQQGPPSGVVPSSRTDFGSVCGIRDTAAQRAVRLTRSSSSKWSVVAADKRPAASDNMAARVWHESNWMVDLHDAPGRSVPVIHTGQMCFDGQGRLTRMIDRYVELAQCRCMRFTSLAFAADGTVTQREEKFVDEMTGAEIGQPAAAKACPGVWQFRRLEQQRHCASST